MTTYVKVPITETHVIEINHEHWPELSYQINELLRKGNRQLTYIKELGRNEYMTHYLVAITES